MTRHNWRFMHNEDDLEAQADSDDRERALSTAFEMWVEGLDVPDDWKGKQRLACLLERESDLVLSEIVGLLGVETLTRIDAEDELIVDHPQKPGYLVVDHRTITFER